MPKAWPGDVANLAMQASVGDWSIIVLYCPIHNIDIQVWVLVWRTASASLATTAFLFGDHVNWTVLWASWNCTGVCEPFYSFIQHQAFILCRQVNPTFYVEFSLYCYVFYLPVAVSRSSLPVIVAKYSKQAQQEVRWAFWQEVPWTLQTSRQGSIQSHCHAIGLYCSPKLHTVWKAKACHSSLRMIRNRLYIQLSIFSCAAWYRCNCMASKFILWHWSASMLQLPSLGLQPIFHCVSCHT